jgi:Asp-tRNAAsn/Glu-tRNAGln amidotransferase A subunit and related amidases
LGKIPTLGYTSFITPKGLRGARIGVLRDLFSSTPQEKEGIALIETAISDIQNQGAFVLDHLTTGIDLYPIIRNERLVHFEKKLTTQIYLDRLGPDAIFRSMGEMIAKHPDLIKDNVRERNKVGPLDQESEYFSLLKTRKVTRQLMVALMDKYQLDALIYPFKTLPAWKISEKMTSSDWLETIGAQAYNPLSSMTGLPALVAPAGFTQAGLPIALEFLGRPYSEPILIRLASGYEYSTQHRKTPSSTPPLSGESIQYSP